LDTQVKGNHDADEDKEKININGGESLITAAEGVNLIVKDVVRSKGSKNEVVETKHFGMFLKSFFGC